MSDTLQRVLTEKADDIATVSAKVNYMEPAKTKLMSISMTAGAQLHRKVMRAVRDTMMIAVLDSARAWRDRHDSTEGLSFAEALAWQALRGGSFGDGLPYPGNGVDAYQIFEAFIRTVRAIAKDFPTEGLTVPPALLRLASIEKLP